MGPAPIHTALARVAGVPLLRGASRSARRISSINGLNGSSRIALGGSCFLGSGQADVCASGWWAKHKQSQAWQIAEAAIRKRAASKNRLPTCGCWKSMTATARCSSTG